MKTSKDSALMVNIQYLRNSLYQFSLLHNGNFPETLSELKPDFIKVVPQTWQGSLSSGTYGYNAKTGEITLLDMTGEEGSLAKDNKGRVYATY